MMPSRKGKRKRNAEGSAGPKRERRRVADPAQPRGSLVQAEHVPPDPAPAAPQSGSHPSPPVVGIGASAGGLDAFRKFLIAMPADSGAAFVLIPHLDPKHESLMVELLARHTAMPVVEAAEGMVVEANHVYIIPPNKYITVSRAVLRLTGPVERRGTLTAIDVFLRSLADDQHERAICVILSGTGTHGTLGLKDVKAAGGMAMVQDPATAEFPQMPRSAIATDLADYVLPLEQMPAALIKYLRHPYLNDAKGGAREAEAPDGLNQILAIIRTHNKLDFRPYRKRMLARRVERRMSLNHIDALGDYVAFLRTHPEEVRQLCSDLLISVTTFFRDPEAWSILQNEVIAPIVRAKEPDTPIRVWCPGCATGEEPYSLGMLVLEQLGAAQKNCPVQIFATDADEDALDVARQAVYPETIGADVSPERLARFFTRITDTSYQVSKQLREAVTFAKQNILADAPFSKLDLVVCRNLLIYLDPEAQKKLVSLLHFALADGGYLFLGPSETIGRNIDLFEPISTKWRIYRRIGAARAVDLQFPIVQPGIQKAKAATPVRVQQPPRLAEMAQNFLLRRFALACVVINRDYEVLHFAGPTEDYLMQPGGPPTQDLLSLARHGLESKLRVVIQRAIREKSPQSIKDVMMRHAGHARRVHIDVEPLTISKQTDGLLLVAFQEQPGPVGETLAEAKVRGQTADTDLVRQLEQELESTREDLQGTIEELESSNEELKASNEEIMSINEELQSAGEEMETSKEELQSLNEELGTVNSQLSEKVHDLEAINNDIANLLNCTDIATIFLDTGFRIKRYTPAATRLFNLIPTDLGRPIGDIVKKFTDDDLLPDAERFLRDFVAREKEVHTDDGRWCVRRILPYRTLDNRIDGVVITFLDITGRKHAADEVQHRLAAIVESSADAIFHKDLNGIIRSWNRGAEQLYGFTADEMIGQSISKIVPDDRAGEWADYNARLLRGEHIQRLETERLHKDGRRIAVALSISPMTDDSGKVASAAVIARDITERKIAEKALRESEERFKRVCNAAPVMMWMSGADKQCTWFNKPWLDFVGRSMEQEVGDGWVENVHADDRERCLRTYSTAFESRAPFRMEYRLRRHDGEYRWVLDTGTPRLEGADEFGGYIGSCIDITDRRLAEEALRREHDLTERIINTAPSIILLLDAAGRITRFNPFMEQLVGRRLEEVQGRDWFELFVPDRDRERVRALFGRALAGESTRGNVNAIVTTDGRERNIEWHDAVMTGVDGKPERLVCIGHDITDRERGEQELRDTKDRLRAILQTAVDSIITINERGVIQSVNPATVRTFGYAEAEMIGKNISMLMPAPYHEEHDGYLARYHKTGERRIIGVGREVEARRKDGSVFPIDLAVSEVVPGKLFTGMIRDITERRRAAMQLQHADRLASIGTLAAGLGHDMNNVLLPVRAHLNALRAAKKPVVLAEGRKHVEEVAKSVSYLQQLADGLHFLAMDPELDDDARGAGDTTDLRQWWSQAGVLISKGVPKHVRVTASIPEGLPRVAVAAHALTQAVLNLVVNAGDAVPTTKERKRRQGSVRVWARHDAGTGMVRLGVTDNGRGMTEEVKRRAFEMFFTTKVRGLGTGLGLALVQRVALGAGGKVEVESEVGKGTTVTMVLKAVGAETGRSEDKPVAIISVADGRAGALARHILESSGARVSDKADPDGADVWFVDPGESALRQAKAWRAAHPHARLVLAGAPGKDLAKAWEKLGPIMVEKAGDFESLRSALARALPARSPG
jgi:two-component system CheB/CheR fusion protein